MLPAALKALKYAPTLPQLEDKTKQRLLIGGVILGALYFGKKWLDGKIKDNADSQVADKPAAAQAKALRAAMNRSGLSWLMWSDGTNTEAIYQIAEQITDYQAVSDFYKEQNKDTGSKLEDDLISEISAEGYQKFLALASKGKTGDKKYAKVREDIVTQQWVITTAEANIRKTPKKESRWMPGNNIIKTVPANTAIGSSTGKFAYDEAGDVTFIEFYTFNAKKQKVFFYVAKSQVKYMLNSEFQKLAQTPNKIPFVTLAGVTEESPKQIISTRPATIYSPEKKPLYTAAANLILGSPIMELNTGKEILIQFKTVQGLIRWVNKADTKTVER